MARKPAGTDTQLVGDKAAARAVAMARADFNAALENRSLKAIAAHLVEDVVLVPGDEAQLITGREAQLEAWSSIFTTMPDVRYVRAPSRIEVCEDSHLAAETGRWTGSWSSDGFAIRYTGRYFAKWRCVEGRWRIEAETFVTMKRSGGG
ncbi:nuclear transport factor 2 family protein [Maricaulis sp.]|uniref:YybH family protein n=1 Tax=Maricaulis sp. TaxID=1486257 RepID=UPI0025BE99B5|nr:nuclear transport factor 2 family protein [Maricaulis sp.]